MNCSASAMVLFIFQLPAISGTRSLNSMPPLRAAPCPRSSRASRRRPSTNASRGPPVRNAARPRLSRHRRRRSSPAPRATASATARVPAANGASSNAPIGPFQNTVPAEAITSPYDDAVFGPMSSPIHPSGTSRPSSSSASVSSENSRPITRSTGSRNSARAADPVSSIRDASSTSSSAHNESPTEWPCAARNGKHIAPPIRIVSARSRNASITPILSLTLAPPSTDTSGRAGSSSTADSVLTSRSSSSPAACSGTSRATPSVDACARCAAPKASSTYTSASSASDCASEGSFLVSPGSYRTFSSSSKSPSPRAFTASETSAPTTAGATETGAPRSSPSRAPTGASDSDGSRSFGRPRCETSTIRAPRRRSSSIVGSAARIRRSSATAPFSSGTLKSTLTSTRLPSRFPRSRSVFTTISEPRRPRDWSNPTRCRTRQRA